MDNKRFLVADPCHIINNEDWDAFGEATDWGKNAVGFEIKGVGKIIVCHGSDGGDGTWRVGNGQEVGVDAGIVAIIELDKDSTFEHNPMLNAFTRNLGTAAHWFNQVVGHEEFIGENV